MYAAFHAVFLAFLEIKKKKRMGGTKSQPAPDESPALRRDLSQSNAELDRVRSELSRAQKYLSECTNASHQYKQEAQNNGWQLAMARKEYGERLNNQNQASLALEKCKSDHAAALETCSSDGTAALRKCAADAAEFQARLAQLERGSMVASAIRASQTPVHLMVNDRIACAAGPGLVTLLPMVEGGGMPPNTLRILPLFDPACSGRTVVASRCPSTLPARPSIGKRAGF